MHKIIYGSKLKNIHLYFLKPPKTRNPYTISKYNALRLMRKMES